MCTPAQIGLELGKVKEFEFLESFIEKTQNCQSPHYYRRDKVFFQNWWKLLSAWRAEGSVLLLPLDHYYLAWFECASFHGNDYCLDTRSLATLSGNVKILIWNNLIINLTDWHVKNNSDPDFRINVWNISTINMKGWDAKKV